MNKDIIDKIFNDNELEILKNSIQKRHCLNNWSICLIYLFHITQSSGILITSLATSYNIQYLIWIGIGLNLIASLINIFEKTNRNISKKLLENIKSIKDGTFIDEIHLDATKSDNSKKDED
jgi:hypothetical protein